MSIALTALVVAVVGFVVLRLLVGGPIAPSRRWGLWALRGAILAVVLAILFNPVQVEETPGAIERPRVTYLVDTSQSMALGKQSGTRWDQVVATIQGAERAHNRETGPQLGLFRFGSRLSSIEKPFWKPIDNANSARNASGAAVAAEPESTPAPTDPDTLLTGSLETLAGRFGQVPPSAVVVFSDGRARDPERAVSIAKGYGRMDVPIHVVPVGDEDVGGDIAIVSMVAPNLVRKSSQVPVQLFVRSYGYQGKRAELKLSAVGPDGRLGAVLARTPVVLEDGLASYSLSFGSGEEDRRIAASIDVQPGEVSADNNRFAADVAIDHTKIRVLYLEGAIERYVIQRGLLGLGGSEIRGAYSPLQMALMEDPDIECTVVMPGGASGDFSTLVGTDEKGRGMPETRSELYAYDAIILSNVPREALSDQHLKWIENWISRRGGGLCMVGGPNSYGSGAWAKTSVANMLPVALSGNGRDWDETLTLVKPRLDAPLHPIWHIVPDNAENRKILQSFPTFLGHNRIGASKPSADVLATLGPNPSSQDSMSAIAVQPYGQGRTMAMSTAITKRWAGDFTQTWGKSDARYYKKFWRNVVYWLTENSSIGRRRLLAETDKRLYRPGEPIVLSTRAFDENAVATLDYRIAVSIEPKSATEVISDDSPLRRPSGSMAPEGGQGPLLPWGEEFDLAKLNDNKAYQSTLTIADAKSLPPGVSLTQGLRIELTAYENNTQVDSTAIDVQILDDPSEQQNPLPDHDLLKKIASASGGKVLKGSTDLAAMLGKLPVSIGAPEIKMMPAWSRWWLLVLLLGLLTVEWIWRRRVGLA